MIRYKKNITVFMIILCMIFSNAIVFGEPEPAENAVKKAVADLSGEFELLGTINLFQGYSYDSIQLEDFVTRDVFAELLCRLIGEADVAEQYASKTAYLDVPKQHWAAKYIGFLSSSGIFEGKNAEYFEPQDRLLAEDAVKALIGLLGYQTAAEGSGGFPMGYMTQAGQIDLLTGCSFSVGERVSWENLIRLLYNAIQVDLAIPTGYRNEELRYEITKGKTLLSERHHMYLETGRVVANERASIEEGYSAGKNELCIKWKSGEADVLELTAKEPERLLGYYVTYIKKEDPNADNGTLLYSKADTRKNDVVTIYADDILYRDVNRIYYEEETGRKQSIDMEQNTKFLYNGKRIDTLGADDVLIESGKLELIHGTGNDPDVLQITKFQKETVVSYVDSENKMVHDKYAGKSDLDLNENSVAYDIYLDEKQIALADLREWDVVNTAVSEDGQYLCLEATRETVQGSVYEVVQEGEGKNKQIVMNESPYYLSDFFPYSSDGIKVGDSGTAYLNYNGNIASFLLYSKAIREGYGFVLGCDKLNNISSGLMIKMLTQENKIVVYKTENKINVGYGTASSKKTANDLYNLLSAKNQLVRFKTDEEGVLTKIIFPSEKLNGISSGSEFNLIGSGSFIYENTIFEKKYYLSNDSLVFYIPTGTGVEEKEYMVKKGAEATAGLCGSVTYKAEFYDRNEMYEVGAAVIYRNYGDRLIVDDNENLCFEKITSTIDADGEPITRLYYYNRSGRQSATLSKYMTKNPSFAIEDLKMGDIIRASVFNGEIVRIERNYDHLTGTIYTNDANVNSAKHYFTGTVTRVLPKAFEVDSIYLVKTNAVDVFIFDSQTQKIYNGKATDLEVGDQLFVRTRYMVGKSVFVYR